MPHYFKENYESNCHFNPKLFISYTSSTVRFIISTIYPMEFSNVFTQKFILNFYNLITQESSTS